MKKLITPIFFAFSFILASLNAYAQPANNECSGAINIVTEPYSTTCTAGYAGVTTGATASTPAPGCTSISANDDVFYTFTATSTTQFLRFSNLVATTGTATSLGFALYDGNCTLSTELACQFSFGSAGAGVIPLSGLSVGTSYILRLFASGSGNSATFNFCVQDSPPPPANDDCVGAISLTQNATCTNTAGTTFGATQSMGATLCTGTGIPDDDVWFSFVATTTDANIAISGIVAQIGTSTTTYFQVFSGTCGALMSEKCNASASGLVGGLTPGQTYYIRVYTFASTSQVNFNICVSNVTAAPTACPFPSSPASGATVSTTPTLTWSSVTNATSYDVYLGTTTPPTTVYATVSNATSYTVSPALAPGTYFWYVTAKNSVGAFTNCAGNTRSFIAVNPPANDECTTATAITTEPNTPACSANIAATTTGSNPSNITETSCTTTSDNDDIFYTFTASGTSQVLRFSNMVATSGTATTLGYHIFSGSCGTLTQLTSCSFGFGTAGAGATTITGLMAGTVYTLQLFTGGTNNSATFNFCIQDVIPPPANDECAGALTMPVTTFGATCTFTAVSTGGATMSTVTNQPNTCTSTGIDDDVFYTFTSTTAGLYTFSYTGLTAITGTASSVGMNVYTGTCGGVLAEVTSACTSSFGFGGTGSRTVTLAAGTMYTLRLSVGSSPNSGSFNFCITEPAAPPANDDCAGAIALTVNTDETCTVFTSGTTEGATQTLAACTGTGADDDVFFSFVATSAIQKIKITNVVAASGTSTDIVHEIFSSTGMCAGLTSLYCTDTPDSTIATGLIVGNTYYVRVFTKFTSSRVTFDICATTVPPPPANDDCAGAIALTVNTDQTCTAFTAGTTLNATETLAACTGTGADDDVFFSFVATSTVQKIKITNVVAASGTSVDIVHQIFSGNCAGLTSLYCTDSPDSTIATGLIVGDTYYVRVFTKFTSSRVTFDICATTLPPTPANDECAGAIAVTTQPFGTVCSATTAANTTNATPSNITETSCATSSDNDDIFYSFTATSTSQILRFSNMVATMGTATALGYQIFSGCTAATQLPSCNSFFGSAGAGSVMITGLTVTTTYNLRLFTGSTANSATFDFCIQDPAPPPANDDCAGAIAITTQPFSVPCSGTVSANTSGATPSLLTETTCITGNDDDDIFYSFTATATSQILRFSNYTATVGTTTTLGYHVFTSCGSGTSLPSCSSFGVSATTGNTTITGLTVGTPYFLQLFTGTTGANASFDFCLQNPALPVTNDECVTAIGISTQAYSPTCTSPTAANTNGATASAITETSCSTTSDNDDIFYSFTATSASLILNFSNMVAGTGTATTLGYQVFPACGGLQLTSCSTGFGSAGAGTTLITGLTVTAPYIIRLFTGGSANSATFDFCLQDPPPPPANDECAGAISLNGGAVINGTTVSATQTMASETCEFSTAAAALDVFYTFTTTQAGTATISLTAPGSGFDAVIQAYSGTCSTLVNIGCADATASNGAETLVLPGLASGQTIFLRVYSFNATNSTFTITASGAALPITVEYFKGSKQTAGNLLEWKVNCTGSPSANMVIERSADAIRFEGIYNTTETALRCLQPFSFTDKAPLSGTNYYRLKSTDADGRVTYSSIIAILNKTKGFEFVTLVPNPVRTEATLSVASATASSMEIIVSDIAGRQLQTKKVSLIAGSNNVKMNFASLSTGVYYITGYTADGEKKTVKFIKD